MNFRSLLVVLDDDPNCDARIQLAARFAAACDCHLIGAATTGLIGLPSSFGAAAQVLDEAASARGEAIERAGRRIERFRAICHALGVASVEADVHEGDPATAVLHHAHCADAAMIGQADPLSPSYRGARHFVEEVLLRNARPTFVVPHAGHFAPIGGSVLVAWDDSRNSARATADAVPLLRDARQVHLRMWQRAGDATGQMIGERLAAVQGWLRRQGVTCEARVETAAAGVGDAILEGARRLAVDLVVMGTYGHSRWTERIVGGATRTALERSPVTLLMSH